MDTDTLLVNDPEMLSAHTPEKIEMINLEGLHRISSLKLDQTILRNKVLEDPKLRNVCLKVDEGSYVHKKFGLMPGHYFVSGVRDVLKRECEVFARLFKDMRKGI